MQNLVAPLRAGGHTVVLLMSVWSSCPGAVRMLRTVVPSAQTLDGSAPPTQAHGFVESLHWFRALDSKQPHEVLIVTRYDLTLHAPLDRWSCNVTNSRHIAFASQCKASSFRGWNCTNDFLHVVPRRRLAAFVGAAGAPRTSVAGGVASGCCFHPSCVKAGGHGCFNALVARGVSPGQVTYCFPQSRTLVSVLQPNAFFELAQCADLPVGSARQRPAFRGADGTFATGCARGGDNRTRRLAESMHGIRPRRTSHERPSEGRGW